MGVSYFKARLIGRPQLVGRDGSISAVPDKLYLILAILACEKSHRLTRKALLEIVWGLDLKRADASFRQLLVKVRQLEKIQNETILQVERNRVTLNYRSLSVDVRTLLYGENEKEDRLSVALRAGNETILEGLNLDHLEFLDWQSSTQTAILEASQKCLHSALRTNNFDCSIETIAEALLLIDPSDEIGYRILMEFHCKNDDRANARAIYQKCRNILMTEYGVEPALNTQQLAAALGLSFVSSGSNISSTNKLSEVTTNQAVIAGRIGVPRLMLLPPKTSLALERDANILDVLLDDITVGLSRFRSISVIAGHTSRQVRDELSLQEIHKIYGVHYALTSSLKPSGNGSVVSFLIYDLRSNECLAGCDSVLLSCDLPRLFDTLGKEVVSKLVTAIEQNEIEFPTACESTSAYRNFLEGRKQLWRSDLPYLRRARRSFIQSLSEAENFAPAHAGLSRTLSMERLVRGLRSDDLLIEALKSADKAVRSDPLDGRGFCQRGFTNLYMKRHDESQQNMEMAVDLNPNDADTHADYADVLTHCGSPHEALNACLKAKTLNPEWPDYYDWIHASIFYQLEEYDNAIKLLQRHKTNPGVSRLLAASHAMAGNDELATHFASILRNNYPEFEIQTLIDLVPDRNAYDLSHLAEGLKRAGVR